MSRYYTEEKRPYEEELEWYRSRIEFYRARWDKCCRLDKEYCNYLERWFSNDRCDGAPDYETRVLWKRLPMAYNTYCFE